MSGNIPEEENNEHESGPSVVISIANLNSLYDEWNIYNKASLITEIKTGVIIERVGFLPFLELKGYDTGTLEVEFIISLAEANSDIGGNDSKPNPLLIVISSSAVGPFTSSTEMTNGVTLPGHNRNCTNERYPLVDIGVKGKIIKGVPFAYMYGIGRPTRAILSPTLAGEIRAISGDTQFQDGDKLVSLRIKLLTIGLPGIAIEL
jgi:hypothetical protein